MTHSKTQLFLLVSSAKATRLVFLCLLLPLLLSCCRPLPSPAPPPPAPAPSLVMTEEGTAFFVWDLRLPGNSQELLLRQGGAKTWLPLVQIHRLQFTGAEQEGFRPATITLGTGERTGGDISVSSFLVGKTDLGFWNIPLKKVNYVNFEGH